MRHRMDAFWALALASGISVILCEPRYQRGSSKPSFMDLWKQHHDSVKPRALGYRNFSCPGYRSNRAFPPRNVHMVRPENVGVIGALGDSITAGTGAGATSMSNVWSAGYRSLSFAIGGAESLDAVVTVPNIFRRFNPQIYGYSLASDGRFNVAVPGSRAKDMPAQAKELVRRIEDRPHLHDSWKVITIFIGTNDICHSCYSDVEAFRSAPTLWIREIERAISILASSLTKTFVNVVSVVAVWQLRQYEVYDGCGSCRCVTSTNSYYKTTDVANRKFQRGVYELVGKYDRTDFTVVVQPFLSNVVYPPSKVSNGPDLSFVSPDCFHYSRRWHAAAAAGLWNNMLQAVGSKSHRTNLSVIALSCPDFGCPYLRTSVNSFNCSDNFLKNWAPSHNSSSYFMVPSWTPEEASTSSGTLWIILVFILGAVIAGGAFCWYRRKQRRGDMDLARLASRAPEDPQAPLMAVHDLRGQDDRILA